MAKKDYRKEAIKRALKYVERVEASCPQLSKMGRNLSKLALEDKLDNVYGRDATIVSIQKILMRKSKANVLLTGVAGCGKTATAERLAKVLADRSVDLCEREAIAIAEHEKAHKAWAKSAPTDDFGCYTEEAHRTEPKLMEIEKPYQTEIVLFELSLTSLTAGTRYRGDFEEKVDAIIKECKSNPNIVLFIDEIHQIVSAGRSDNSDNAAQMFKPALARREMCVVGATTEEEARYIWEDKALARRFNEVKVAPLCGEVAHETAVRIMNDYSQFHSVEADVNATREILAKLKMFLPKSVFPDNFINVVDETLAGAKFDGLTKVDMTHFNATLSRMAGVIIV
jgi:ATP-dependent Clp protease ATP-binding subunit ClpA